MNGATVQTLYLNHFSGLVREITPVTHSPSASEDIVQDCLVKLLESDIEPKNPWPDLRNMARNAATNLSKRRQFEQETFMELTDDL